MGAVEESVRAQGDCWLEIAVFLPVKREKEELADGIVIPYISYRYRLGMIFNRWQHLICPFLSLWDMPVSCMSCVSLCVGVCVFNTGSVIVQLILC